MKSFVYCWTDHKNGKLYVGSHKGSPNDGYICSSKTLLEQYKERPNDFTRQIVAEGDEKDIRCLEAKILEASNARINPCFYNKTNGDADFYPKGPFTKEHKQRIGDANRGRKGQIPWNKGIKLSPELIEKMNAPKRGKISNRKGATHTSEAKEKNRLAHLGKKHSLETKEKMRMSHLKRYREKA